MGSDNSVSDSGYVVGIDPDGMFSVFYEDGRGRLIFVIEVDDTPKKIYLNPRALENDRIVDAQTEPARERVSLAVDRVKAYFEGRGVTVVLGR